MDDWDNPYLQKLRSISVGSSGLSESKTDTYFHDKQVIEQGLKSLDPNERKQAQKASEKIRRNSLNGKVMKLRKELVGLHRSNDVGGVKEIHEVIKKNE